ncbi:MAG TPA: sigma-54-dependent Fis family transcriptional regulator [Planctomycetaceae bacterium]|nr:sigma-54-dependent Fis family transcriptional regulator [Planctomycetaceae bacterium]HRF01320.1 sigma 54-interacting transcriptional regulator [Pirellulaceae bacterium]
MLAYLVIRDGTKWSDVFRLVPGRRVTVGRATTNQIVIRDELASRQHAEIFLADGRWHIRDLDSRNGVQVNGESIRGDHPLTVGDQIRIAGTQLAFVTDLANAYRRGDGGEEGAETVAPGTMPAGALSPADVAPIEETGDLHEPTVITHRRQNTRLLEAPQLDSSNEGKLGNAAAKLCKLAFDLARQPDPKGVAQIAVNGLIDGTQADAGAVLTLARDESGEPKLHVLASRSDRLPVYRSVSRYLADTVIREGEAVLARDIAGDSKLGIRDSQGEMVSTSVICAPIRSGKRILGLIHLYSTEANRSLDPVDLEFTLAVAENMAVALTSQQRQQVLADDLSKSRNELDELRQRLAVESEIVGSSTAMLDVHGQIVRAAPSNATVLVRGESGVGKELVARAVHFSSPRRRGPFVCLNCAALTESLLESELFGHEKGAFTGATERKIGKFEAAHKGTLMLDEIGEMSMAIQSKFLRVLEGHPFERVGGSKPIKVDVRVIAATNRNLETAVREGNFRKDLYFRLHVLEIQVPPLRKRPDDLIELAEHFLKKFNAETGRRLSGFSPDALRKMRDYHWPGNVRELKNVVERAVVLARGERIEADDLALTSLANTSESFEMAMPRASFVPISLTEMERRHIAATLEATGWNKSQAAGILEIERSTLDRKIRKYDIRRPSRGGQ